MNIDVRLLRECNPQHLARLARALRVNLPAVPDGPAVLSWRRRAAHLIADAIEDDRFEAARAAMEEAC